MLKALQYISKFATLLLCGFLVVLFIASPSISVAASSPTAEAAGYVQNDSGPELLATARFYRKETAKQFLEGNSGAKIEQISAVITFASTLFVSGTDLPSHGINIFLHRYNLF